MTTLSVKKKLEEVSRHYRGVVTKAAYLSRERPDMSYSAKELARDMQQPTEQSMTNLQRFGRYLKKRPRLVQLFVEQTSASNVALDVYGDSDHAGCLKTRKSTTGMVLMREAHCLKVSSHAQSTISLSSGESEYYGIVKCAAVGIGARSMLAYFGMFADVVVRTGSSSGVAVGSRRGLSQLRHVQTRYLWVRQPVQEGDVRLKKEPGDTNVSDALTKPDGLRVERRADRVSAGSTVTNCRMQRCYKLRRIAN